jgi:sulfur carrier protein ThiS
MTRATVHVYATLRKYVQDRPSLEVEIEAGQTVATVLDQLGIPADEIRILFVNNRAASLEHELADGDRIGVFPAIGGG